MSCKFQPRGTLAFQLHSCKFKQCSYICSGQPVSASTFCLLSFFISVHPGMDWPFHGACLPHLFSACQNGLCFTLTRLFLKTSHLFLHPFSFRVVSHGILTRSLNKSKPALLKLRVLTLFILHNLLRIRTAKSHVLCKLQLCNLFYPL